MTDSHISEDEMILHFYDEPERSASAIEDHLRTCAECQARLEVLRRILNSVDAIVVPERGEFYGREVWNRIRGRLQQQQQQPGAMRTRRPSMNWKVWGAVAAMFAIGLVGFLIGRSTQQQQKQKQSIAAIQDGTNLEARRQRVLLVALTDHFERSQMVLAELSNADPGAAGKLDIRYERDEANDLLDSNRLYRQAAVQQGDTQAAVVLDDLERMLLEVAHAPDRVGPKEFEDLRRRIEDQGLVFKVKILTSRLERQGSKL